MGPPVTSGTPAVCENVIVLGVVESRWILYFPATRLHPAGGDRCPLPHSHAWSAAPGALRRGTYPPPLYKTSATEAEGIVVP